MVLINALTFAGAFAIISIKSFSCMPKDPTESLSKYLISIFHQLAPNYYPALRHHTIIRNLNFSESRMILSVLGYFSFSISFKYDFDKSVILAKPNKDKFYSSALAWVSVKNQLDIILFYVHISKIHQKIDVKNLFSILAYVRLFCKKSSIAVLNN
jgi:hypothetical protein